jgi:NAD-dependent SIR2 family protein deacetylase
MPECQNCGNHVTDDYCRVFVPDEGAPEACPQCEDMIRANGKPRPARSARHVGNASNDGETADVPDFGDAGWSE